MGFNSHSGVNMRKFLSKTVFAVILSLLVFAPFAHAEESFLLFDAKADIVIAITGNEETFSKRISPFSTFKIVLSLIGYDSGILKDENTPEWSYEGQDASITNRTSSPRLWMDLSLIWYSQILTQKIGLESMKHYLSLFDYGNQNMSGDPGKHNGLTQAWLNSSLKISIYEQSWFLKQLVLEELPVSKHAIKMTKKLLYNETLKDGWKLYGKTGSGYERQKKGGIGPDKWIAWYIGWIEKDSQAYVFALNLRNIDFLPSKSYRQEIVKQYLLENGIIE